MALIECVLHVGEMYQSERFCKVCCALRAKVGMRALRNQITREEAHAWQTEYRQARRAARAVEREAQRLLADLAKAASN